MSKVSDLIKAIAELEGSKAAHCQQLAIDHGASERIWLQIAHALDNGDEPEPEPAVYKFTRTPTLKNPRWRDTISVESVSRAEFRVTVRPKEPPPNNRRAELFYVAHIRPRDGKMEYQQLILLAARTPTGVRLVASPIDKDKTRLDLPGKIQVGEPNVLEVVVDLAAGEMSGTWAGEPFTAKLHPDGAEAVDGPVGVQIGGDNAYPTAETTVEVRLS